MAAGGDEINICRGRQELQLLIGYASTTTHNTTTRRKKPARSSQSILGTFDRAIRMAFYTATCFQLRGSVFVGALAGQSLVRLELKVTRSGRGAVAAHTHERTAMYAWARMARSGSRRFSGAHSCAGAGAVAKRRRACARRGRYRLPAWRESPHGMAWRVARALAGIICAATSKTCSA